MKNMEEKYLKFFLVGAALLLFHKLLDHIALFGSFFHSVWTALFPVTLSLIIVFFAYGPSKKIELFFKSKDIEFLKKKARMLSLLIIYTVFITFVSIIIRFLLPAIYDNLSILVNNLPSYLDRIEGWIREHAGFFKIDIMKTISNTLSHLLSMQNIISSFNAISSFFSSIFSIFTAIILSVYILNDREHVVHVITKISRIILRSKYDKIRNLYHKTANLFYSYFIGLATDAALIGIITMIFLTIVGSPYAVLLGFIVCIGNLIPIFGSVIASIVIYLLSAVSFGPVTALWILLFQLILGQIDGNFIQPKIISRSVNLSPIWIILSVIVFGNFFGAIGMIIGTPLVASAETVIKAIRAESENNETTTTRNNTRD